MSEASSSKIGRVLLLVGRLVLGGIMVYAASTKLHPPLGVSLSFFAMEVDSYQLLPANLVSRFAHVLPFVELILGLLLIVGWPLRTVATATTALLAGFFGVMVRTYALGLEISCGCFGPGEKLGTKTLLRDGTLLALSIGVAVGAFLLRRHKLESPAAQPVPQRAE